MSRPGGTIFLPETEEVTQSDAFVEEKLHPCPVSWPCGGKNFGQRHAPRRTEPGEKSLRATEILRSS